MCHKKIKVALIDNMNNNFFAFARYLRDAGIDAHLYEIPNNFLSHFSVQSDTFEEVSTISWIKKFPYSMKEINWLFLDKKKLFNIFCQYDIVITCGLSSAYLQRSGINSDIIIPYGGDIYAMPFRKIKFEFSKNFLRSFLWANQAKFQKKAYQSARAITIRSSGSELYENALKFLKIDNIQTSVPMLYNKENYSNKKILENYFDRKILDTLDSSDFIVFNHSRQYWTSNYDQFSDFEQFGGGKRNDKLIKAFAKFLKTTAFKFPLLVLFEYGYDLSASKQLITELNIEENILWMPISPRKVILVLLQNYACLGTDQFRENISSGYSGTAFEVLSSGVPLLTHNSKPDDFYKNSPIIDCLSIDDIFNVFIDYEKNPEKYKKIGIKSQEWFNQYLGVGSANKFVKLIELFSTEKLLTQNDREVRDIFEK